MRKKIGFHQPSNSFPLTRIQKLFQKCVSDVWETDKLIAYTVIIITIVIFVIIIIIIIIIIMITIIIIVILLLLL